MYSNVCVCAKRNAVLRKQVLSDIQVTMLTNCRSPNICRTTVTVFRQLFKLRFEEVKQTLVSPILFLGEHKAQICDARYSTDWPKHVSKAWVWQTCAWRIFPAHDFSLSAHRQVKVLLSVHHWHSLQSRQCWAMGGTGPLPVTKRKYSWPAPRREGCRAQQLLLRVSGVWEEVLELLFKWSCGAEEQSQTMDWDGLF